LDGREEIADRVWGGDELLEAGVVAEDVEGEAAGCGGDARVRNRRVDSGDEGCGMDGSAERGLVLEEEKVADVGEVGLAGAEEAFELAEVDEGRGFEDGCDGLRISRSWS
jgi:hypothetical protein